MRVRPLKFLAACARPSQPDARRGGGCTRTIASLGVILFSLLSTVALAAAEPSGATHRPRRAAFAGDGGEATRARLNLPQGVAIDPQGNGFMADTFNHRIARVDGRFTIVP